MFFNAGQETGYERRQRPIWPELAAAFRAHGGHNYSTCLPEQTRGLFGWVENEDEPHAVSRHEVFHRA